MNIIFFVTTLSVILIVLYLTLFFSLGSRIKKSEDFIVDIFLEKMSKIPAVIEVMRPYVADPNATFCHMTRLHSEGIIHEYTTIHMLMEHNARINDQYSFLMKLSMAIPDLQKDTYFLYIRDFVMSYDRMMRTELPIFNTHIRKWNWFINLKNWTLIGYVLPGRKYLEV